ncbi:MAG TPA: glycosyltransferase family 87 protein [Candidatus Sulfotelmatobacter sp.]|nr:glycosyltransferase family 87 protein [Candidatus Sulfotelmatobacter sp.]
MSTAQPTSRSLSPGLLLCLALIAAASMLYYHQALFIPRAQEAHRSRGLANGYSFGNDFYQIWLSSRALLQRRENPYSAEMTREIQTGLYGRPLDPARPSDPIDQRAFPYPAFVDLLFLPAAVIPFPIARIIACCALAVLTIASVLLWLRVLNWNLNWEWTVVVLLLTLSSYPALEGLYAAQIGLLVSFLLAASVRALQRDRYLLSGTLLALTAMKPQVTILAVLYLLIWNLRARRARRFYAGYLTTLAVLAVAATIVLPHWISSWIHTILAYRHYTPPPLVTQTLTSFLGPTLSSPATLVLTAAAIGFALILAWKNRTAPAESFPFLLALTILLSITAFVILPGLAVYDHVILLPGILLLFRYRKLLEGGGRIPRIIVCLGALILFWPWIAAFAMLCLRPILAASTFQSTILVSLPIRTAASLPFVVLALLALILRAIARKTEATV